MKTKKLLPLFILACITLLGFTTACNEKGASSRLIPIPEREHGYSNFESTVITSQDELDKFLTVTSKSQETGWNNRKDFDKAVDQAKIDFSREALLFIRHTEGSGSVQLTFQEPKLVKDKLILEVDRKAPQMGTADMAYYCVALAVVKKDISTVEVKVSGKEPVIISLK